MRFHPVRLRKRLDLQSLVATERHPVTGRLVSHGRADKSRSGAGSAFRRFRFAGGAGFLAAAALIIAAAAGAAAAVKAGGSSGHPSRAAEAAVKRTSSAPARKPSAAVALPSACQLVSREIAQRVSGVTLDLSGNKPTDCLYAGTASSPFRTIEVTYYKAFNADQVQRTLRAAHVVAQPIPGLGFGAFAHPAFLQTAGGKTQLLPAEAVVKAGSVTVVISTITIDESSGGRLVDPAHDEAVAVNLARSVLASYAGR